MKLSVRASLLLLALLVAGPAARARAQEEEPRWGPWWVLLPIDHPPGHEDMAKAHPPERSLKDQDAGEPGPDLEQAFRGKEGRDVRWRRARGAGAAEPDFAEVDLVPLVDAAYPDRQAAANLAVAYAYRTIEAPGDMEVPVFFGSDDSCRVWLNGDVVHEVVAPRGLDPRGDRFTLRLERGTNHLFVKVGNAGGAWKLQLEPQAAAIQGGPQVPQKAINDAIDRGIVYLLRTQNLDGSWGYHAHSYRNGQTALSLYALMKSGVSYRHPAIQRGFAYLNQQPPRKTYSMACQILALVSTKDDRTLDRLEDFAAELEDWQRTGYAYPGGEEDLSCTQYGALGLYAAQKAGVRVNKKVWPRLLKFTLTCHNSDGGFSYRPGGGSTGSMTVAGLTVIAICRAALGDAGLPNALASRSEEAERAGLEWLAAEFQVRKNPRAGDAASEQWKHYYLYGVERLAALLKVDRFGPWDWYQEGARFYVESQGGDGSWATAYGESEPNTAFGLLFLSRGTASLTGEGLVSRHQRIYGTDEGSSRVVLRAAGDTPLDLWITGIHEEEVKQHARDGEGGHGLYVQRAEYLADGELVREVPGDPSRPWKGDRYAMQHRFPVRGDHTVQVRLVLAKDPLDPGREPAVISSPVLAVRVDELQEDWMFDYPDDQLDNLVLAADHEQRASSNRGGDPPNHAFDGYLSTGWSCNYDDAKPTLTLSMRRALRFDRIVLSHRNSKELWRGEFDRATRVAVRLDGSRKPEVFELDPDEERKTVLEFKKPVRAAEIEIEVLERLPGTKHKGSVGFAEVELRLGD
jgi:hypothetical protein